MRTTFPRAQRGDAGGVPRIAHQVITADALHSEDLARAYCNQRGVKWVGIRRGRLRNCRRRRGEAQLGTPASASNRFRMEATVQRISVLRCAFGAKWEPGHRRV